MTGFYCAAEIDAEMLEKDLLIAEAVAHLEAVQAGRDAPDSLRNTVGITTQEGNQ